MSGVIGAHIKNSLEPGAADVGGLVEDGEASSSPPAIPLGGVSPAPELPGGGASLPRETKEALSHSSCSGENGIGGTDDPAPEPVAILPLARGIVRGRRDNSRQLRTA